MNQRELERLRYRVVFGNLSTLDVSADELTDLFEEFRYFTGRGKGEF